MQRWVLYGVATLALLGACALVATAGVGARPTLAQTVTPVPGQAEAGSGADGDVAGAAVITPTTVVPPAERNLALADVIGGDDLAAKSIVATPGGLMFAQNMMYRHTVTVYDASGSLVATIDDEVDLSALGVDGGGVVRGAPVEAASTSDGSHVYVSNYAMYGDGYGAVPEDSCEDTGDHDASFVYRVDTATMEIDRAIEVGAVPKFLAVTPDDAQVLVANWCSSDLSVIDTATGEVVDEIEIGRHPRGIVVDETSSTAYVAVMGGHDIAVVDLGTYEVEHLRDVGDGPRHLALDPDGRSLYATLNRENRVIEIDPATGEVVASVDTGVAPRTMAMSPGGDALYVVNYGSDTLTKVRTADMTVVERIDTGRHPVGVAYHPGTGDIWVSNYADGTIQVFADG